MPRVLRSFPTRRSSDLFVTTLAFIAFLVAAPWLPGAATRNRSEEHTSELQSHSDIVCRLLLEKKNIRCFPLGELCFQFNNLSEKLPHPEPIRFRLCRHR